MYCRKVQQLNHGNGLGQRHVDKVLAVARHGPVRDEFRFGTCGAFGAAVKTILTVLAGLLSLAGCSTLRAAALVLRLSPLAGLMAGDDPRARSLSCGAGWDVKTPPEGRAAAQISAAERRVRLCSRTESVAATRLPARPQPVPIPDRRNARTSHPAYRR